MGFSWEGTGDDGLPLGPRTLLSRVQVCSADWEIGLWLFTQRRAVSRRVCLHFSWPFILALINSGFCSEGIWYSWVCLGDCAVGSFTSEVHTVLKMSVVMCSHQRRLQHRNASWWWKASFLDVLPLPPSLIPHCRATGRKTRVATSATPAQNSASGPWSSWLPPLSRYTPWNAPWRTSCCPGTKPCSSWSSESQEELSAQYRMPCVDSSYLKKASVG